MRLRRNIVELFVKVVIYNVCDYFRIFMKTRLHEQCKCFFKLTYIHKKKSKYNTVVNVEQEACNF